MKVGRNNRLVMERDEGLAFRFVKSPNTLPGTVNHKYLFIHATEGPRVHAAVKTFRSVDGGTSAHLILGRDGKEIVQMVDFNVRAQHAYEYNTKSLGIELDYTGPLTEDDGLLHHFTHISRFQPGEYIYAVGLNDRVHHPTRLRPWPVYPKEQMDSLVKIARLLVEQYDLEIVGHEEIHSFKFDPGPTFPMLKFKDVLAGRAGGSLLFDETGKDLELRTGPGVVYPLLPGGKLNAGTPVAITSSYNEWVLVEVMAEVRSNPWLVGWAKQDTIIARHATPVVKNHKLFTTDGQQYRYIPPHPNNYDANRKLSEIKYVVIHTTDGIDMQSTINSFTNGTHGASSHLLIGRDGGVVQFVDFDTIAYHCGTSYWEEASSLNRFSIGIELDNGGMLSHVDGVWKWKTTIIPEEEVTEAQHWKLNAKRGWHRFTDVQIAVAKEIILALQAKYGINVLLTHDVINLQERGDPGPLFPLEDFRTLLTGQPGVPINVYKSVGEPPNFSPIFKNREQKPPDPNHPRHGVLPARTKINIQDVQDDWTLIKVGSEASAFRRTTGWIRSGVVNSAQQNPKTTQDSEYFKLHPSDSTQVPPSPLKESPLPAETRLRINKFEGNFALVAALVPVRGHKYLEGWVKRDDIVEIGEESLIYPPPARIKR